MITHSRPWITDTDIAAVKESLKEEMLSEGSIVRQFEQTVSKYIVDVGEGIAVSSGTAALILALKALNVSIKDEVILPTYVCHSVVDAVLQVGAVPIFCDVGKYWNMTPESVVSHITSRTKAIVLVHIFGIPVNTSDFLSFNIPIIEDCSQAFGAKNGDQMVGSIGTVGTFSFHATKCLTTGEGGMVVSRNLEVIEKLKDLRHKNIVPSPLTNIQAALGLSQFKRYEDFLYKRKKIAQFYIEKFPCPLTEKIKNNLNSIFFRFPIIVKQEFESIKKLLENENVCIRKGVDHLLHRNYGLSDKNFPNAIELFNTTVSVPIYPALLDEEYQHINTVINRICS